MNAPKRCGVYALAHFLVDFSCAGALGWCIQKSDDPAALLLIYNFCAFALQMPFGILADHYGRSHQMAAAGCALIALAVLAPHPMAVAIAGGVGNSLFHIGGGTAVLRENPGRALPLGVFVSPGAFGIFLGTIAAVVLPPAVLTAAMFFLAFVLMRFCGTKRLADKSPQKIAGAASSCMIVLSGLLLFAIVCLRSFAGMGMAFDWKTGAWSAAAAAAVVLGKAFGAAFAERMGLWRASACSLALSAGLFLFCDNPFCATLAIALFNVTMPVTLLALAILMPGQEGFAFGLLTFALFLGFLPTALGGGRVFSGAELAAICAVSLALLAPALVGAGRSSAQTSRV